MNNFTCMYGFHEQGVGGVLVARYSHMVYENRFYLRPFLYSMKCTCFSLATGMFKCHGIP